MFSRSSIVTRIGLVGLACSAAAMSAAGQIDRILDTPTGWIYRYGASPATIDTDVGNGWKPFSIERVASDSYNVVSVWNGGDFEIPGFSTAHTYWAVTPTTLENSIAGERIIDLDCFELNNQTYMSAITIPNSGEQAASWGWLYGQTAQQIIDWVSNSQTPIRVIDIEQYTVNGQTRWAAVAVNNSGAQAQGWSWLFNATSAQVTNLLSSTGSRLIDIEVTTQPTLTQPALYTVIAVNQNPGGGWWHPGLTSSEVSALMNQTGSRLTCQKKYIDAFGTTRYAVATVDNANDLTRRVRGYMDNALDNGVYGFKLQQVGGPVLASLNEDFAFEPASMIKIVHGAYAVQRCSQGNDNLLNDILIRDTCNNDECPDPAAPCNTASEDLQVAIAEMLQQSDNNRTMEIELRYGRTNLNNWVDGLGLTNTHINHRLGCLCGNTMNTFSCTDAANLYEKIADGTLFNSAWRDELFDDLMNNPSLNAIVDQEAVGTSLTSGEIATFKSLIRTATKGGAYSCNGTYYRTEGGWASLPFKVNGGILGYLTLNRQYTFAAFVHGNTSSTDSQIAYSTKQELLRDQIRAALESWDVACSAPVITNQPDTRVVTEGANVSFVVQNSGTAESRQWQKSANGISGWVSLANSSGQVSGATSSTLNLINVNSADAGYYRCVVSSDCGNATSTAARLTVNPACRADFNNSGTVTVQDVFDFLNAYFAANLSADMNNSGTVTVQDVFDFLNLYFAGC